MQLQDPRQTKVIVITTPEPTPVLEARGLADDLERAGIHPWGWVVNNSLAAAAPLSNLLRSRAESESVEIAAVKSLADRVAVVPLLAVEPVGQTGLADLAPHADARAAG